MINNYPSEIVELKPVTTPQRSLTRSKLIEEGRIMAATVMPRDFVCCEIGSQQECWEPAQLTILAGKHQERVEG